MDKKQSKENLKEQQNKEDKQLPPLAQWKDTNITVEELMEMGYSYEEIIYG